MTNVYNHMSEILKSKGLGNPSKELGWRTFPGTAGNFRNLWRRLLVLNKDSGKYELRRNAAGEIIFMISNNEAITIQGVEGMIHLAKAYPFFKENLQKIYITVFAVLSEKRDFFDQLKWSQFLGSIGDFRNLERRLLALNEDSGEYELRRNTAGEIIFMISYDEAEAIVIQGPEGMIRLANKYPFFKKKLSKTYKVIFAVLFEKRDFFD